MDYGDFRIRIRALGYKFTDLAEEFGIGVGGIYQWKVRGIPRYAEYWLYWKECEERERTGHMRRIR